MKIRNLSCLYGSALAFAFLSHAVDCYAQQGGPKFVLEGYPTPIYESKEAYRKKIVGAGAGVTNVPFFLLIPSIRRWTPGQTINVAFNGGETALYDKISQAATIWLKQGGANLKFSFKNKAGNYRTWSSADSAYAGEIRVAFETGTPTSGHWSHLGTDSINRGMQGGVPGQASMNLDAFDRELPSDWETTVVHEFGHALGFEHEHQSPAGRCDFRFEDDPGYVAETNADGWHIPNSNGNRPGLYTFLGGYANFWKPEKVDHNLRSLPSSSAYLMGSFDKLSVMKYYFDPFMFVKGTESDCYTDEGKNVTLSAQDIVGVQKIYPKGNVAISALLKQQRTTIQQLSASPLLGKDTLQHLKNQLKMQ